MTNNKQYTYDYILNYKDNYLINNMSITTFLNSRGFNCFEGFCQLCQPQVEDLINLTNKPNINIMEIGFNAGHSAEVFLQNNFAISL